MKVSKGLTAAAFLGFAALVIPGLALATTFVPEGGTISFFGKLNSPSISCQGGAAYLQLTIAMPDVGTAVRRPMNLSVVLDRSGSMADQGKIEYAKRALYSLIDQLHEEDIFSLVIYDNVVEVLQPAQHVGDKHRLRKLVEHIYPGGATNLGGGMVEGFHQVERNSAKGYANRVVLLSDGLANQGITDPNELDRIARRERGKSISLTTMGVGLEYNENLMMGLAENGGGNYYFIESPNSLASIMRKEFNLMSLVCVRNAVIELYVGKNVVLKDAIGCDWNRQEGRYLIPIGDLYSNDRRELTVELRVPEGTGSLTVASGSLRYEAEHPLVFSSPSFSSSVEYTADLGVIEKNRDLETQAKADVAVSTRAVDRATKALDEGKPEQAAEELRSAHEALNASPAALSGAGASAIQGQMQRLDDFQSMIKDSSGDTRRAKKAIQYENYKSQKGKQ